MSPDQRESLVPRVMNGGKSLVHDSNTLAFRKGSRLLYMKHNVPTIFIKEKKTFLFTFLKISVVSSG